MSAPPLADPADAVAAIDELRFDYIAEALDFAASYAVSAREAARRRSQDLLKLHTDQAKKALHSALEVESELGMREAVS
jgi:hypothetical protein